VSPSARDVKRGVPRWRRRGGMADMMAKALEEQAAMQAEMDRQMASLDVRPPARCAAHARAPGARTRGSHEEATGRVRSGRRRRARGAGCGALSDGAVSRLRGPDCAPLCEQMIGTDAKAPASNGSQGCYEANYTVRPCGMRSALVQRAAQCVTLCGLFPAASREPAPACARGSGGCALTGGSAGQRGRAGLRMD